MSRYCGSMNAAPILAAAQTWKDVTLGVDGSVFGNETLWTIDNLNALDQFFIQNLDEGEGNFLGKLSKQLEPTPGPVKQLAAEMMWFMLLCPSNIGPASKRKTIGTIWEWSGSSLPRSADAWLTDDVLAGVGSAGLGFSQHRWRELIFCIRTVQALKHLSPPDRETLLTDPWRFARWLGDVQDAPARQLRHMLVFLLFPDHFERIFGRGDREKVVTTFGNLSGRSVRSLAPDELDRILYDARTRLESQYGTNELDFYTAPLVGQWRDEGFRAVVDQVTAGHVRAALEEIERDGVPPHAASTMYDLIYENRPYPPKYVLSLAAKHATGAELDRSSFTGGEHSPAFAALRRLGFTILPKQAPASDEAESDAPAPEALSNLLTRFIEQAKEGTRLTVADYPSDYHGFQVRVSFGQGHAARIPWIAFLGPGQTVSKGIYPVFLFFKEQGHLLLCYGVSETHPPDLAWEGLEQPTTVAAWFKAEYGSQPDRYGDSFVAAPYAAADPLPIPDIVERLDSMLELYSQLLLQDPSTPSSIDEQLPVNADIRAGARQFAEALRGAHVTFGEDHDVIVAAFLAAILAKPLVILTGLSGSGKTQLAVRFGEWLGPARLQVCAVRPDWTGAEALFGYENGLRPTRNGLSAWSVPAALEFMLRAAADPQHPYLLLLDEMNLAHVERYFADVLSGMESGQPCLPNLRKDADGEWRLADNSRPLLPLPRNLWVVGTVNVDETTYMFSPKVLDRASTFEFRVDTDSLSASARKPVACSPGDPALIRGLLSVSMDHQWQHLNPSSYEADLVDRLKQLHGRLSRHGLEFGHRAFFESLRFGAIGERAGIPSLEAVLDRIVMQKILPRIHGSRRRLEPPLLALASFARDLPDVIPAEEELLGLDVDALGTTGSKLPVSFRKIRRLLTSLRANQFVSFAE